jgi:hypothetical protein
LLALADPGCAGDGRYYVKRDANGANDGSSWENAYTDLHSALAHTTSEYGLEVWVARGTYKPSASDPDVYFQAWGGVALTGGFAGFETSPDERDLAANRTILSGDLNGDDEPGFANFDDNSELLLYSFFARISDFTLTGSTQAAVEAHSYQTYSSRITRCALVDNRGLGIASFDAPPIERCRFLRNGDAAIESNFRITGRYGVSILFASDCLFQSCGMLESAPAIRANFPASVIRCTFVDNPGGVGLSNVAPNQSSLNLFFGESILWRNGPSPISGEGPVHMSDCLVEHATGLPAPNRTLQAVFDADPLFVDGLGPDGLPGTFDEDFHLTAASGCIDRGAFGPRAVDLDGVVAESNCRVDLGAFEGPYFRDCNGNGLADMCEILGDESLDQDDDGQIDTCPSICPDCNGDGICGDECEPDDGPDDGGDPNEPAPDDGSDGNPDEDGGDPESGDGMHDGANGDGNADPNTPDGGDENGQPGLSALRACEFISLVLMASGFGGLGLSLRRVSRPKEPSEAESRGHIPDRRR